MSLEVNANSNKDLEVNNSKQTQLSSVLAPENIDSSKILTYFNENLEASLNDIANSPELSKILENNNSDKKEELSKLINSLNFLSINKDNSDEVKLVVNENLTLFSLLNLPFSINQKTLLEQLPLLKENYENGKIQRIYKKSLFWVIITEDEELIPKIEEYLKSSTIKLKDEEPLSIKYDITKSSEILKQIKKQISTNSYNKEINDLKKTNNNNNDYSSVSSQKLSWRKKSNDTTEVTNNNNNIGRFNNSNSNRNSGVFHRASNNNISSNNFSNNKNVRDRYHSDGQQHGSTFKPKSKYEEIEIDLSKINYSLKLKHKYTNGDILLFYDKFRINKDFEEEPKLENFVEEICNKTKKKEFNFLKRERSMTYSIPVTYKNSKYDDVKLNLDAPSFNIPNSNPLSGGKLSGIQLNK